MKKPNIDLSKEGLKRFFLHHIEKVILVFALLGFLAFLWLGWSTEQFDKIDPSQLSQKAEVAKTHIVNKESWNNVAQLRVARDKADVEVATAKMLDSRNYEFGQIRGTPIRSLSLRNDPDIALAKPIQIELDVFEAPILFSKVEIRREGQSELDKLPQVSMMSEDDGGRDKDEVPVFGDKLTDLQSLTMRGVQPSSGGADPERQTSVLMNVVVVKGLVQHELFDNDIKSKLENSFGYYPERDRPQYQLVQVQRKEAGGSDKWTDITERIVGYQDKFFGYAPEVIAPENHDMLKNAGLSGRIPPIALVDYRAFAAHSALPPRQFKMKTPEDKQAADAGGKDDDPGDFFGGPAGDEGDESDRRDGDNNQGPVRKGSDESEYGRSKGKDELEPEFKVVRFFDLDRKKPDVEYAYRFRIWMVDPNNESSTEPVGIGGGGNGGQGDNRGGRGGRGGGIGGIGGAGGFGGLGGGEGDSGGRGGLPGGGEPGGGRGGDGSGDGEKEPEFVKTPISDDQKDISVRSRIDREKKERATNAELKSFVKWANDKLQIDLAHSRATDWAETSFKMPNGSGVDALAGKIENKATRNSDGQLLYASDADSKVVVSELSANYGTMISMLRTVRRGDLLSFKSPTPMHVLHVVDGSLRTLAEYTFRANRVVVDLMGGEEIPFKSPVEYRTPGEILVLDLESGEFKVKNSMRDKSEYLNRLFQADESSEFNLERSQPETQPDDDGGGRGGFGGLGSGR